jgi:hypothetical protein
MALAPPAGQQPQIIRTAPPPPDGKAVLPDQPRPNLRVGRLRSWMLAMVASAAAFGALAAVIAFQANQATYDAYRRIVDEGSVSVDAALRARAAALDHMTDAATYLETSGEVQQLAAARANEHWAEFSEESRVSWGNLSDPTHGEHAVFEAADRAARDYIQRIGSMFAFEQAGQADRAGDSFLAAREIMNTQLVPALTGLEAVKVELMEDTYSGAAEEIARWQMALVGAAGLLALVLLLGLFAVRRMHYRWSWPVGAALVVVVALGLLMWYQLDRAAQDARTMVRQAYDSVAGVQDMSANMSQARALESIAIFDPEQSATHLNSFDQYHTLVEQRLCGPRDCTVNTFIAAGNSERIDEQVAERALEEQSLLGLPRPPLVANVAFSGQAPAYEQLRTDYRAWLDAHGVLAEQVRAGDLGGASATSSGSSVNAFDKAVQSANSSAVVARTEFNKIWQGVYLTTGINRALAFAFLLAGLAAAWGIWARRSELFLD